MWFTANLLFKPEHGTGDNREPLWEELIILLEAEDESAAKLRAMSHGKAAEHEYANALSGAVRWSFERIERICEIEETVLKDGTELFSRFLRNSEVRSLLTPFED